MKIECMKYKAIQKGTFLGFADLFFPETGMEIYSCTLHKKDDKRWVNLPVRAYKNDDGTEKFSPIVRFRDQKTYTEFCTDAKVALDEFFLGENLCQSKQDGSAQ